MKRALTGWIAFLALLAGPPLATAATPGAVAQRVAADVVHVDPTLEDALPPAAAGRVRLAILDAAIGRIKVAVVPVRSTRGFVRQMSSSSVAPLRGALLVTDGRRASVSVSHSEGRQTRAAVSRAFARGGPLEKRLDRSVRAISALDPGPSADAERAGPVPLPPSVTDVGVPAGDAPTIDVPALDRVGDAVSTVVSVVGAIVALPFLLVTVLLGLRWRRRRAERRDAYAVTLAEAREDFAALGDGIRELDERCSGAAPALGSAYALALDRYDEGGRVLGSRPTPAELVRARRALAEGDEAVRRARLEPEPVGRPSA